MSEEFFERLECAAINKMHKNRLLDGVEAMSEALKEMMVGEPQKFRAYHQATSLFLCSDNGDCTLPFSFHVMPSLGRGEEVTVLAVRLS